MSGDAVNGGHDGDAVPCHQPRQQPEDPVDILNDSAMPKSALPRWAWENRATISNRLGMAAIHT